MATVIPNGKSVQRLGGGAKRRKVFSFPGNGLVRIGTSGSRNNNDATAIAPMQSVVRLGTGGGMPTNNEQSGSTFDTTRVETATTKRAH